MRMITSEEDLRLLQEDLDRIYQWGEENNMSFNSSKFQELRLGRLKKLLEEAMVFTQNMSEVMTPTQTVVDLGITVDDHVTYNIQRQQVIKKALQKSGWILRTFKTRDKYYLKTLWLSLVQPIQDYCSQLWSPVNAAG